MHFPLEGSLIKKLKHNIILKEQQTFCFQRTHTFFNRLTGTN